MSRAQRPPRPAGGEPSPHDAEREDARERLLRAALQLFAAQGFATTSTRELAEAAQVNVAAISYYFGDKAGLYRAAFFEPLGSCDPAADALAAAGLPLAELLRRFFAGMVEPLRQGEVARQCVRLRYREMLEPTGLWQEELAQDIKPMHARLVDALAAELGCAADDELHRLAVCLTGLAVYLHIGHDVIDQVAPALHPGDATIDGWIESLTRMGLAMVDAERARRAAA